MTATPVVKREKGSCYCRASRREQLLDRGQQLTMCLLKKFEAKLCFTPLSLKFEDIFGMPILNFRERLAVVTAIILQSLDGKRAAAGNESPQKIQNCCFLLQFYPVYLMKLILYQQIVTYYVVSN